VIAGEADVLPADRGRASRQLGQGLGVTAGEGGLGMAGVPQDDGRDQSRFSPEARWA
jgi:hypothetical protein